MIDFSTRSTEAEAMDDPAVGTEALHAVFEDLNRTNTILGGQRITLNAVKKMMEDNPSTGYTICDMGCGDGDLLRRLAFQCRHMPVKTRFIGIDSSRAALAIAVEKSKGYPEIGFSNHNLLEIERAGIKCDIVLCSLTLHHFSENELPLLVRKFAGIARLGIIINDLQRNKLAYYLFKAFSRIFIKTKIAKQDGLISIRRGFSRKELQQLSAALPNLQHQIRWRWIFRYLWVMQTKGFPLNE